MRHYDRRHPSYGTFDCSNGGRRYSDIGPRYPLWQYVGREVRGPRWRMLCFYREFIAFWRNVIEWTEEGRN